MERPPTSRHESARINPETARPPVGEPTRAYTPSFAEDPVIHTTPIRRQPNLDPATAIQQAPPVPSHQTSGRRRRITPDRPAYYSQEDSQPASRLGRRLLAGSVVVVATAAAAFGVTSMGGESKSRGRVAAESPKAGSTTPNNYAEADSISSKPPRASQLTTATRPKDSDKPDAKPSGHHRNSKGKTKAGTKPATKPAAQSPAVPARPAQPAAAPRRPAAHHHRSTGGVKPSVPPETTGGVPATAAVPLPEQQPTQSPAGAPTPPVISSTGGSTCNVYDYPKAEWTTAPCPAPH